MANNPNRPIQLRPARSADISGLETTDFAYSPAAAKRQARAIYVDGLTGNDGNDGLAVDRPLLTLGTAMAAHQQLSLVGVPATIYPAAGSRYAVQTLDMSGGGGILSTTQIIGPSMTALYSDLVVSTYTSGPDGTGVLDLVTGVNFSAGGDGEIALRGYYALVKRAGVKRYFELPILLCSGSAIMICTDGLAIVPGDTVSIVTPAATIVGVDEGYGVSLLRIVGDSAGLPMLSHSFARLAFENVYVTARNVSFDRCVLKQPTVDDVLQFSERTTVYLASTVFAATAGTSAVQVEGLVSSRHTGPIAIDADDTPTQGSPDSSAFIAIGVQLGGVGASYQLGSRQYLAIIQASREDGAFSVNNGATALLEGACYGTNPHSGGKGVSVSYGAVVRFDPATFFFRGQSGQDIGVTAATALTASIGSGVGGIEEVAGYNGRISADDGSSVQTVDWVPSASGGAANATKLQGTAIDAAPPNTAAVLAYNLSGNSTWEPISSIALARLDCGDGVSTQQMNSGQRYISKKTSGTQTFYVPNGSVAVGDIIEVIGAGLGEDGFNIETLANVTINTPNGVLASGGGGQLQFGSGRCAVRLMCTDETPGAVVWTVMAASATGTAHRVVVTVGDVTLTPNAIHYTDKVGSRQVYTIPDDDLLVDGTWFEIHGCDAASGWQVAQPNNSTVTLVVWAASAATTSSGNAGYFDSGDQYDAVRIVKKANRLWHAIMLRGTPSVT